MATIENNYVGNGSTVLYSFTFPYLRESDVKVTINGTLTTSYTFANATTLQFNTAPANGAAIRIYRSTDDSTLLATFYPGSAIRSQDLNENFIQNLYVTQESVNFAAGANTRATTALANANTAISTANAATSTANTASSNAAAAVSTANTASSNASAAVSTANTASSNAAAAVSTANTASSNASAAVSTANTASSNASAAVSTANSASTTAAGAVSTANAATNTAQQAVNTANSAVSTANSAVNTANSAISTANTALSNANSAITTANNASATANQAISAVANALLYTIVATKNAIPASPANNDAVEITDSTGIQTFTPLIGLPYGFVGDPGLSVRIKYSGAAGSWVWLQYFPNDPDNRYAVVELIDGGNFVNGSSTVNGSKILDGGTF
jgi:Phage T7 tail fibre protein